jgi:hypothetical protein
MVEVEDEDVRSLSSHRMKEQTIVLEELEILDSREANLEFDSSEESAQDFNRYSHAITQRKLPSPK